MANQRDRIEPEGCHERTLWIPLESALEEIGQLLADFDPTPKVFRQLDPEDSSFGIRLLVGITEFFDTLRLGSAAFAMILARSGWYPGGNLPLGIFAESASLIMDGKHEGEEQLAAFYEDEAEAIATALAKQHPTRAEHIHQSMNAHKNGDFFLSVPANLILAEAIASDLGASCLYSKTREGAKRILNELNSREDFQVAVAFLAPLLVSAPIDWSPDQRQKYGNPALNRHAILHGEVVGFGTRLNSLRSFSHLAYVSDVLGDFGPDSEAAWKPGSWSNHQTR